ncbi:peptidoglycan-binding protein [Microbacterium sp. XT11]|uniref:peptidoglycan-binding protein n=1 Tax=Microbacterium sp. XT11 TaxID=367477 RepID=UPI000742DB38|nr:peptidoglycan-binding protein [Microbacterium sp. XT11]ALX66334.1 hypothetical protein AB663_001428 [Microbacterium sp. XT11]
MVTKLPIPFARHTTYPDHSGVDFPVGEGTIVKAAGNGKIVGRGYTARAGYYVRVKYGTGAQVMSCHLRNLGSTPPVGRLVAEGSVIGASGNTGHTTGPHLHQEVDGAATTDGYWRYHDPNRVIGQGGTGRPVGRNLTKRPTADIQRLVGANPDGKYGPDTTARVMAWQSANGLTPDGIWGQLSDAKGFGSGAPSGARPTIRRGDKGPHVLALQTRLKTAYSLYAGKLALDSDFGPATERAVKEFQRRAGLAVDGIVGPNTWKALGL